MTTPGRIAAIVTCRDLGRFLGEALASIERQTRPAAEILVVDDASTDVYTRQILAQLARAGTYIVHAHGRGAAAARNRGAQLTSAEYLVWLDADDTLEPTYFASAAGPLDTDRGIDFVSCAMRAFGDASYVWTPSRPAFVDAIATGGVPHASTMIRRDLWTRTGGFDETLPSFELLDFWATALEQGARGVILDAPLLNYRVRAGSGYRQSIQHAAYLSRCAHLYDEHREAIERHWSELILQKEAFLESQRQYRDSLEARAATLQAELSALTAEVTNATRALETHGTPRVSFGDLGGVAPLSPRWGRDRGTPIDRYYIEQFLERHRADIRGRVLEVRDAQYATRFGAAGSVCDVVDRDAANPEASIIADLTDAPAIAEETYDCIILTQTLQLVDDIPSALAECTRILRPGGILLATAPSMIRVDDEAGVDGDFWRLTEASGRALLAAAFPIDAFEVATRGNVKACTAFLHGLSVEEMTIADLEHADAAFPLVVTMRAVKPIASPSTTHRLGEAVAGARPVSVRTADNARAAILSYHRIADLSPDSHRLCTPADTFRAHMTIVRDRFTPIRLEDLLRMAASGSIPDRAVVVTLDDGYVDALSTASPILSELGIPATFFINSDRLGEPHERWWDVLERVCLGESNLPRELSLHVAGGELRAATVTTEERAAALECLNRAAWPLDASSRRRIVADVLTWSGVEQRTRPSHRVMTSDEVRRLAARPGHTIGAHTTNHLALTTQTLATKRLEIEDDKAALENIVGRPVDFFSYPYGELDAETLGVVREAGFLGAVTVEAGIVRPGTNRLLLPRIEVTPRDQGVFEMRLQELFD